MPESKETEAPEAAPEPKAAKGKVKCIANAPVHDVQAGGIQRCWGVPFTAEAHGDDGDLRLVAELDSEEAGLMMEAGRVTIEQ